MFALVWFVLLFGGVLQAQGWTTIANTKVSDTCHANNGTGGGQDYANYGFANRCHYLLDDWNSAIVDTTRTHFVIWGAGHSDSFDNSVNILDLTGTPSLSRVLGPSTWTGTLPPDVSDDGNPSARHTYGGEVYMPQADRMFEFSGVIPAGTVSNIIWTLDLSVSPPVWHNMGTVVGVSAPSDGAYCAYDASRSDASNDVVLCVWGAGQRSILKFTYDLSAKTVSYTILANSLSNSGNAINMALEPNTKRLYFIGDSLSSPGTLFVQYIDASAGSSWNAVVDITSTTTGCSAMAVDYPGWVYDTDRGTLMGYPNAGNSVYEFNTTTKTCTQITYSNGPTGTPTTGTLGHFNYIPALHEYIVMTDVTLNAYVLTLTQSQHGSAYGGKFTAGGNYAN